jgi:hypothetical protein
MAAMPALNTPETTPAHVITGECKWCKKPWSTTRKYPKRKYCNQECCRKAFEHRMELKIADKILKRRERLRAKRAREAKKR